MSTVSVIIPIYNAAKYLRQCLDSITHQTHRDLEIILVNDGSTDGSLGICREYEAADSRFVVVSQPNGGQTKARNAALDIARGEYVAFVDADDWVDTDYIEQGLTGIGTADVCAFSYTMVDLGGQVLHVRPLPQGRRGAYVLSSACMKIFRRRFLEDNHLRFGERSVVEDIEFSFCWWTKHFRVETIDYNGYYYRQDPTSTTGALHSRDFDTNAIFRRIEEMTSQTQVPTSDGKYLAYYLLKLNLFLLKKKKAKLTSAEFCDEWQRNDQTITSILHNTGWSRTCWVRGEQTAVNILVTAIECAKLIGLCRPMLRMVQKVY